MGWADKQPNATAARDLVQDVWKLHDALSLALYPLRVAGGYVDEEPPTVELSAANVGEKEHSS